MREHDFCNMRPNNVRIPYAEEFPIENVNVIAEEDNELNNAQLFLNENIDREEEEEEEEAAVLENNERIDNIGEILIFDEDNEDYVRHRYVFYENQLEDPEILEEMVNIEDAANVNEIVEVCNENFDAAVDNGGENVIFVNGCGDRERNDNSDDEEIAEEEDQVRDPPEGYIFYQNQDPRIFENNAFNVQDIIEQNVEDEQEEEEQVQEWEQEEQEDDNEDEEVLLSANDSDYQSNASDNTICNEMEIEYPLVEFCAEDYFTTMCILEYRFQTPNMRFYSEFCCFECVEGCMNGNDIENWTQVTMYRVHSTLSIRDMQRSYCSNCNSRLYFILPKIACPICIRSE